MKSIEAVDAVMAEIPEGWRRRWCGGERGACACLGCVQIGNRAVMYKASTGQAFRGDPEYLREDRMSPEVVSRVKLTQAEWAAWCSRNPTEAAAGSSVCGGKSTSLKLLLNPSKD